MSQGILEIKDLKVSYGAVQALRERVSSLLPVGVVRIDGQFERGDLVAIAAEDGTTLGYGKVQYGAEIARKSMGQKGKKPLVHYDYLYLD